MIGPLRFRERSLHTPANGSSVSPAGRRSVARPLVGSFTVALLALTGCGNDLDPHDNDAARVDAQTDSRFDVVDEAEVIQLFGVGDQEHVVPSHLEIISGSWVEFVNLDRRIHTVSFVRDSLSPEAYRYLLDTGQLSTPPLLERRSRLFVDFREAPPGEYIFSSTSHGQPAYGRVTVRGPQTN